MFFPNGTFCPSEIPHPLLREMLIAIGRHAGLIRPAELLAYATRGNATVREVITQSLREGEPPELLDRTILALVANGNGNEDASPPDAPTFSDSARRSLDELAGALALDEINLTDASVPLLCLASLGNFDQGDRAAWTGVDVEVAIEHFRKEVASAVATEVIGSVIQRGVEAALQNNRRPKTPMGEAQSEGGEPSVLPHTDSPIEDLTRRVASLADERLPHDEDPSFEQFVDRFCRTLHRGNRGHVILSADRGVGVDSLLVDFARRALRGAPPLLRKRRFVRVNCRFTPPEESRDRLLAILARFANDPELTIFIDGFASLLRNPRGASNKPLLLSSLSDVRCQIVGILEPRDCEELVADDLDFLEYFSVIEIPEPSVDTALKLMRHYALGMERQFAVQIDERAVDLAVTLSASYVLNERLPHKAVKLLARICESIAYDRSQGVADRTRITVDDVLRGVAEASGISEQTLAGIADVADYEQSLAAEVVGQPHAVKEVADELGLIKAGFTEPGKPASVMLFVGQTGTGKTEMAKVLARFYSTSKRLRTYTLGNFVEPHSVAGIIGVPPGYVGHDQGGRIVNELRSDPHSVFLLDEADKAHPDVLQPFLNLFDEGWIVDQRGVKAYADRALFILTTNVGQRMLADMAKQGKQPEEMVARMKETLSQIRHGKANRPVFAPEFLARIKRIIVFMPLNENAMVGICRKQFREAARSWSEVRHKGLNVDDALIQYIGARAHQINERSEGREGGRIVRKLIADVVESPIQREIGRSPPRFREAQQVHVGLTSSGEQPDPATPAAYVEFR